MKNRGVNFFVGVLILLSSLAITSCEKMFDIEPENALDGNQHYKNLYDADAAVVGIYGKLLRLADRYIILNELRADLMDVTPNSGEDLRQLSRHEVDVKTNKYSDPRPFYELILNCNDVLNNLNIMVKENKIPRDQYNLRYSDIGALRSWLYLQLGVHWGEVPYITQSLENVDEVKDQTRFSPLPLSTLVDSLVNFTKSLPVLNDYPTGNSLVLSVDGYVTSKFFINKKVLLGDLYLWQGKYVQAAEYYRDVMKITDDVSNLEDRYNTYKMTTFLSWDSRNTNPPLYSFRTIFNQPLNNRQANYETIWLLPFDRAFNPVNPFISLFSPIGGQYLLKPSKLIVNNWDSMTQGDGTPGDPRGSGSSYVTYNGDIIAYKYLMNLNTTNPFDNTTKWILHRAAAMHLRYAEAANRAGKGRLAYAFLNNGLKTTYDPNPSGGNERDVTAIQNTMFMGAPWEFDARIGNYPNYRSTWHKHAGIRGRVGLPNYSITDTLSANMLVQEEHIAEEAARELAMEGYRWPDLVRIAMRREKEVAGSGSTFLKSVLSAKFTAKGEAVPAGITALTDPKKWFLPFKWQ